MIELSSRPFDRIALIAPPCNLNESPVSFISKVGETLHSKAAELTVAAIVALTGTVALTVGKAAWPAIVESLKPRELLTLLALSGIGNVLALILIWQLRKPDKMHLDLGIYWDSKWHAHCPACKSPLSSFGRQEKKGEPFGLPGWLCQKCGKPIYLSDRTGKGISLEEAIEIVKASKQAR
jgi:hypothetical protein